MPDGADVDKSPHIVDRIDDAVIPNSNPPKILGPFEFPAPRRSRIVCERFDSTEHPHAERLVEPFELLTCAAGEGELVGHHYRRLPRSPSLRLMLSKDSRGSFARDFATATS